MLSKLREFYTNRQYSLKSGGTIKVIAVNLLDRQPMITYISSSGETVTQSILTVIQSTIDCEALYVGNFNYTDLRRKARSKFKSMVHRVLGGSSKYRAYKDCTISENFLNFEFFCDWCIRQVGFQENMWCLDKDLLSPQGCKSYSEDTCVFLPQEINNSMVSSDKSNLKVGVAYDARYNLYVARFSQGGENRTLGHFSTEDEAFLEYKVEKEKYYKYLARKWKGEISKKAYNELLNKVVH